MSSRIEVMLGIKTIDIHGKPRHEWITDSRKITGGVADALKSVPDFMDYVKSKIKPTDTLITEQVSVTCDHLKCISDE